MMEKNIYIQFVMSLSSFSRFDSSVLGAPLIFANQFLQLTTTLSSDQVYGLGEHKSRIQKGGMHGRYVMWNKGQHPVVHSQHNNKPVQFLSHTLSCDSCLYKDFYVVPCSAYPLILISWWQYQFYQSQTVLLPGKCICMLCSSSSAIAVKRLI